MAVLLYTLSVEYYSTLQAKADLKKILSTSISQYYTQYLKNTK
jgi:hypothetical protein